MKTLWFGACGIFLVLALLFYRYSKESAQEHGSSTPRSAVSEAAQTLNTTLSQNAEQRYDDELRRVETAFKGGHLTIEEATRKREEARILLEHDRNTIAKPIKACPQSGWLANGKEVGPAGADVATVFWMDLTGCTADSDGKQQGSTIWLQLGSPYELKTFAVKLYKYGQSGEHVEIVNKPDIRLLERQKKDGFSLASEVSPGTWQLRGDVFFFVHGDADRVEFTKLP